MSPGSGGRSRRPDVHCPVRLTRLDIDRLRNLKQVQLDPGPGLNLLLGANGSGKSSLLEGIHVLAHGRSFRAGSADDLIQRGQSGFDIHSQWQLGEQPTARLGMARRDRLWLLRLNDADVANLGSFVRHCAAVAITPDSQLLITGPAEGRRRYLDWLLFHVEHEFLDGWRRYQRALRQRNLLLRRAADAASLDAWEAQMASAGELVNMFRRHALSRVEEQFKSLMTALVPSLGEATLLFRPGWPTDLSLEDALRQGRDSDRERGFSQRGPHRCDWRVRLVEGVDQDQLSRGQAKLVAICCLLAQTRVFQARRGHWPVILLDDLASELDQAHQELLLGWLDGTPAQRFVTSTELRPGWPGHLLASAARFHVEQGRVTPLL